MAKAGLGHTLALLSDFMQVSFSVLPGGLQLAQTDPAVWRLLLLKSVPDHFKE